jgi:GNAT superfamily N-acetyltransferase
VFVALRSLPFYKVSKIEVPRLFPGTAPTMIAQLSCLNYRSVREIFIDIFDESEDPHFQKAWRHRDRERSLGIFNKEKNLVGFVLVEGSTLAYIGVDRDHQSYQYGTTLLRAVLSITREARKTLTLTPVDNKKVVNWYTNHGFRLEVIEHLSCGLIRRCMHFHSHNTRSHSNK